MENKSSLLAAIKAQESSGGYSLVLTCLINRQTESGPFCLWPHELRMWPPRSSWMAGGLLPHPSQQRGRKERAEESRREQTPPLRGAGPSQPPLPDIALSWSHGFIQVQGLLGTVVFSWLQHIQLKTEAGSRAGRSRGSPATKGKGVAGTRR